MNPEETYLVELTMITHCMTSYDVVHTSADLLSGVVGYLCARVHVISPEEVPGYAGAAHQDLTHLLFGDTEARDNIPSQHIFCLLTRKPLFVAIRFSLL